MIEKTLVTQCVCNHCRGKWIPKDYNTPPRVCPYCKRYDWNKKKIAVQKEVKE